MSRRVLSTKLTPGEKVYAVLNGLDVATMDDVKQALATVEAEIKETQGKAAQLDKKLQRLRDNYQRLAVRYKELSATVDPDDQPF